jgi:EmrB/QacA subfamily drug resistance transporter
MSQTASDSKAPATRKRWTMVAVVLGSGIVFLDSTVVNVALPRIGKELPSSLFSPLEAQNYVYNGYLLTLSALLILAGALSDYYGRRRAFAIGLAGFGVTSLACGLAWNMESLIVFRLLQGAAGALLVPGSLSIINTTFQGEERGRAFGVWAGASAATTILGPFIGGLLVQSISWRAAFLINIPLVLVALYATVGHVAESRDEEMSPRFDWMGAGVVAIAVGGLAYGTIRGQQSDWSDVSAFVALGLGAVGTLAIVPLMRTRQHPLIPPSLFRSRNFTVTNISTLVIYGALYVTFFNLGIFVQGTLGYDPAAAGIMGIPGTLLLVLFSTRFGTLAARHGPRLFMTVGPALMALGVVWYVRVPPTSDPWVWGTGGSARLLPPIDYLVDFLPGLLLFGAGLMIMVAPLTTALMTSVPEHNSGVASAINNAISRVGPQLAGALIFVAIASSFYSGLGSRVPGLPVRSEQVRTEIAPLNRPDASDRFRIPGDGTVTGRALIRPAKEASTHSFHVAMLIGALMLLTGAAVNAFGIRNPPREERKPAEKPETTEEEAPTVEPAHEAVGVGVLRGTALHDEFHDRGELHHHHVCTPPPQAGTPVGGGERRSDKDA